MLAGFLFATHETEDRSGTLAATLPFAGLTLIEYQARLLIAAGAAQVIVVVERLTPELLGAIARIGKRGVAVDTVRTAREAADRLHPLARVLMLADGLVTSEEIVRALAGEGGDALLVVPEGNADAAMERVGGERAWAGIARLDPQRIAEVAALPRDYDLQSTLLRLAAQARAAHLLLPPEAAGTHGVIRHSAEIAARGRALLGTLVAGRRSWFDRYVVAPFARLTLPPLVERHVPTIAPAALGFALGIGGIAATILGAAAVGLLIALIGCVLFGLGHAVALLRDEAAIARVQTTAIRIVPAIAVLAYGRVIAERSADGAALATAILLVVVAALGERAIREDRRRRWWGGPAADLAIVVIPALAGLPLVALIVGSAYATATLLAAIDSLG